MKTKPSAFVSKITFSGGASFALKSSEKIVLVGPNNSGKSQCLREIVGIVGGDNNVNPFVATEVHIAKVGTVNDLQQYLEDEAELVNGVYRFGDWNINKSHLQFWGNKNLIHGLAPGFIRRISADDRLTICAQQNSISPGEKKAKPQHVLYDDGALMAKISGLFSKAFGKDLMFDFRGGSKLPIHVGKIPATGGLVDRVSDEYVKAVRENPLLDKQGDGMKSYAGILFEAVVANLDVTLIDEPEAFLHPPQMRRLGETLSSEVSGQLIVATHSSDIMRGFLEGTKGNVRILRIRREGAKNYVSEASSEVIKELWEKPDLRYSNALEGIFHEQVIICEDDSDCRLINSFADHLAAGSTQQWADTAYVPTGGKHAIPRVASVLRKIGVPVKAVFDIDFLAEKSLVNSAVDSFGGDWDDIRPYWERVDAAVRTGVRAKTIDEIKKEICEILSKSDAGALPKGDIIEVMKHTKEWALVKRFGASAVPHGQAQRDYAQLMEKLEQIGIYLVPVGEVENFCPSIGLHGPKFVTKFLSEVNFADEQLKDLRAFVEKVHFGAHGALDS